MIRREVKAVNADMVAWRRDLHAHPEASWSEHRTTAQIRDVLLGLGLKPEPLSGPTGLWVDILPDQESGNPRIGLRADIDALELEDTKRVPYRSSNRGVAHACGHDAHTAILLGTATVLARLRAQGQLPRGVRLFFQPAEEVSPGGATDIIQCGGLEGLREVYALHCDPRTEVGKVAMRPGPITSACDRLGARFFGPGGHSSRPHLTADLVMALGTVITQVPVLLSRRIDPRAGASIVWGKVEAGSASNAIPATGYLTGTLRCLDLQGWQQARELVPKLIRDLSAPYGVTVEIETDAGIPPTVNDPAAVSRMIEVCSALLGADSVADTEQSLGGEDFSEMVLRVPGALGRLGVRPAGALDWPDLHRPGFDIDETCLAVGAQMMVGLVALHTAHTV